MSVGAIFGSLDRGFEKGFPIVVCIIPLLVGFFFLARFDAWDEEFVAWISALQEKLDASRVPRPDPFAVVRLILALIFMSLLDWRGGVVLLSLALADLKGVVAEMLVPQFQLVSSCAVWTCLILGTGREMWAFLLTILCVFPFLPNKEFGRSIGLRPPDSFQNFVRIGLIVLVGLCSLSVIAHGIAVFSSVLTSKDELAKSPMGVGISALAFSAATIYWATGVARHIRRLAEVRKFVADMGVERLDKELGHGSFELFKSILNAEIFVIRFDPNPSPVRYVAQVEEWSAIGRCYGLRIDARTLTDAKMTSDEIRSVIFHEIYHMKQNRPWTGLFIRCIALPWGEYLLSLMTSSINEELAADAYAAKQQGTSRHLISALKKVDMVVRQEKHSAQASRMFDSYNHHLNAYTHPHISLRINALSD